MAMLLFVSACGYHLRGQVELSEAMKNIALQSASGNLVSAMKQLLRGSNAKVVSRLDEASLVVKVQEERMQRRVLSLDSTGRANEFELTYRLTYQLRNDKGKPLSEKPLQIELYRSYFNNQVDILAKNNEETVIREELYQQAAKRILSQARMLSNQHDTD